VLRKRDSAMDDDNKDYDGVGVFIIFIIGVAPVLVVIFGKCLLPHRKRVFLLFTRGFWALAFGLWRRYHSFNFIIVTGVIIASLLCLLCHCSLLTLAVASHFHQELTCSRCLRAALRWAVS